MTWPCRVIHEFFDDLEKELREPTDKRMFAIVEALKKGYSIDDIAKLSKVTPGSCIRYKILLRLKDN